MAKKTKTTPDDHRQPFQINLSETEKDNLSKAAVASGMALATFIRVKALEAIRVDPNVAQRSTTADFTS